MYTMSNENYFLVCEVTIPLIQCGMTIYVLFCFSDKLLMYVFWKLNS